MKKVNSTPRNPIRKDNSSIRSISIIRRPHKEPQFKEHSICTATESPEKNSNYRSVARWLHKNKRTYWIEAVQTAIIQKEKSIFAPPSLSLRAAINFADFILPKSRKIQSR
jgi:hypothetical protein